jgi:hypothetical protein
MANQNYSEFKSRKANKNSGGPGVTARKGSMGAEHGPAQKDDPKAWPKPGPTWGTSFNRAVNAPVVKTRVVKHGVD